MAFGRNTKRITPELISSLSWAIKMAKVCGLDNHARVLSDLQARFEAVMWQDHELVTVPKAKPKGPKYPHFSQDDCRRLYQTWTAALGATDYREFREAFGPLYEAERGALVDTDTLDTTIKIAAELLKMYPRELSYMTPERFAGKIMWWVEVATVWPADRRFELFNDVMRGRQRAG